MSTNSLTVTDNILFDNAEAGLFAGGVSTVAGTVAEDVIVSKTTISSLRRFKDDVKEVNAGMECGVLLADTNDIKPGDHLEVFEVEERARTL